MVSLLTSLQVSIEMVTAFRHIFVPVTFSFIGDTGD